MRRVRVELKGPLWRDRGTRGDGGPLCLDFGGAGHEGSEQRPDGVTQVLGAASDDGRGMVGQSE